MVDLSAEMLRSLYAYDPDTGLFNYRVATKMKKVGDPAGYVANHGYVVLLVGKKIYLAHRLAWLYIHGRWPDKNLDHINKDLVDNRMANLRECLQVENMQNKRQYRNNSSGCTGVVWNKKSRRWQAQIQVRGKNVHLGFFVLKDDAIKARKEAEPVIHPFSLETTR